MTRQLNALLVLAAIVAAYFVLAPMLNDDSCKYLGDANMGVLNRVSLQVLVNCWAPWN